MKYFLVIVNFYEIRVKYFEALSRSGTVVNHIKPGFKELASEFIFIIFSTISGTFMTS